MYYHRGHRDGADLVAGARGRHRLRNGRARVPAGSNRDWAAGFGSGRRRVGRSDSPGDAKPGRARGMAGHRHALPWLAVVDGVACASPARPRTGPHASPAPRGLHRAERPAAVRSRPRGRDGGDGALHGRYSPARRPWRRARQPGAWAPSLRRRVHFGADRGLRLSDGDAGPFGPRGPGSDRGDGGASGRGHSRLRRRRLRARVVSGASGRGAVRRGDVVGCDGLGRRPLADCGGGRKHHRGWRVSHLAGLDWPTAPHISSGRSHAKHVAMVVTSRDVARVADAAGNRRDRACGR